MARVRFDGNLKRFGTHFDMVVETGAEALRGLLIQIPGLRQHMNEGRYRVRVGKKSLSMDTLEKGMHTKIAKDTEVRITPVVAGAKSGGLFQIVLGAALIGASFFVPASWGAAGAAFSSGLFAAGTSLAIGGVAQLLSRNPKSGRSSNTDNGEANNYFSSLENVVGQGDPIPLLYGRMRVGSHVISQGLITDKK